MAAFGKKKKASEFPDVIPVSEAIRKGDIFTKLTCLIMGAGNLARKQIIQGLLFLTGELAYILYMVFYGAKALQNFVTLGTETQKKVFNEATQVYEYATGDNSQLCLLYGVVTFFVTIGFILLWRAAIRSSYIAQKAQEAGKKPITFGQILKDLKDNRMYQLFLLFPFLGIILFTVMPLVFMILMAFTNYDRDHLPPGKLFDWVGFQNFARVLNAGGALGETFWRVLCNLLKLYLLYYPGDHHQPGWDEVQSLLAFYLRTDHCCASVCIPAGSQYHDPGARCNQSAVKGTVRCRTAAVLDQCDLGESDSYCHQPLGRHSLYAACSNRYFEEYSCRAVRSGKGGRRKCVCYLL